MSLLKVGNADFGYDNLGKKTVIVSNLSFEIFPKSIVLLEGKNGSGKTTILKTLKREIPLLKGEFLITESTSYIPQESSILKDSVFTVNDVMHTADPQNWGKHNDRIKYLLSIVGLEHNKEKDFGKNKFAQLSGGQRQRVLIARALVKNPQLILMDEPINHIDKKTKEQLAILLENIVKEEGCSIFLTSHTKNWINPTTTIDLENL